MRFDGRAAPQRASQQDLCVAANGIEAIQSRALIVVYTRRQSKLTPLLVTVPGQVFQDAAHAEPRRPASFQQRLGNGERIDHHNPARLAPPALWVTGLAYAWVCLESV